MKRVAILTFHRANNYGAVLQAYALTQAINKLGAEAEILDYRPADAESYYHSLWPFHRSVVLNLILLHHRILRDNRTHRAFADFRQKQMRISSRIYHSYAALKAASEQYDIFVAGSDQIWNPDLVNTDDHERHFPYMLDFVHDSSKKNSYAASIGRAKLREEEKLIYREKLGDFSTLTVREHEAAKLLSELLNRPVSSVCDPVLLHSPGDWVEVEQPVSLKTDDYMLVYNVGGKTTLMPYAQKLAEESQCTLYAIQPPIVGTVCKNPSQQLIGVGPAEFVWLIRHARAVVTNSFHGAAFSLLFGKELHVKMQPLSDESNRNSRFDSLFRYYGILTTSRQDESASADGFRVIKRTDANEAVFAESRKKSLTELARILQ